MKRIFILGSNPGLSAAEILARLNLPKSAVNKITADFMIIDSENQISPDELMATLGGTIKIGQVLEEQASPESLASFLENKRIKRPIFGISQYGLSGGLSRRQEQAKLKNLIHLGMDTKRLLKEAGIPSRFVRPQEGLKLSSVSVNKNKILEQGVEFILFGQNGLAITEAIQPFEEFSQTDFGRPARDAKQGMLPPKLALIMLNLAQIGPNSRIWDPFCGSGTILTEAYRIGIKTAYGSDINPQAISDTEENLDWIKDRYPNKPTETTVTTSDARQPLSLISNQELDAIISETYLGPPRNGREKHTELSKQLGVITLLVEQSLSNWKRYLKTNALITLALPAYITDEEILLTEPHLPDGYEWHEPLPSQLAGKINTQLTKRGGILYGRKNQLVWREIVRLKRVG